jgi:hypothetical protein
MVFVSMKTLATVIVKQFQEPSSRSLLQHSESRMLPMLPKHLFRNPAVILKIVSKTAHEIYKYNVQFISKKIFPASNETSAQEKINQ